MTLAELQAKLPSQFQPLVQEYGPAFLAMSQAEIWAWLTMLLKGNVREAYAAVLAKLPDGGMLDEWNKIDADWAKDNKANADNIALQKAVLTKLLIGLASIAFAVAGF